MNDAFQQFKSNKKAIKGAWIEDRASITLEWYQKIQEMLESDSYIDDYEFLQSVLEFIEQREYITEKQLDICTKIFNHPKDPTLPF